MVAKLSLKNDAIDVKNKDLKIKISKHKEKMFKRRKDSFQEIATKRINDLFIQAEEIFEEDSSLSKKYVSLARTISLKYKVSFTKLQKTRYCKKCGSFLKHGLNSRLRLSKGNIVIKCLSCNNISRSKHK